MKNNLGPSRRGKGAAVGLVICFVAVIALVGFFTFSRYKRDMSRQLAKAEEKLILKKNKKTLKRQKRAKRQTVRQFRTKHRRQKNKKEETQTQTEQRQNQTSPTATQPDALAFSENDLLAWPVDGNVLMNYSMDQTIYFSTLDQYKYNPALIIGGEVGTEVTASARGIVKSVEVNAQTGNTVTMDLGNGYEAVYGQLKEVPVQEGNYVEQGELVGYLSEPTKYYSVEGCNLYFQLLKDGEPVNPMEYMDS